MKKIFYVLLVILLVKILNNEVTLVNTLIDNIIQLVQSTGFTYFVIGMSSIMFDKYIKSVISYFKAQYTRSKQKYLNEVKRNK